MKHSTKTKVRLRTFKRHLGIVRARRPRRARRGRMRAFGIQKKRYLIFVPVLLLLIVLSAYMKDTGRAVVRFRPAALKQVNPLMGWAVDADSDPDAVEIEHSMVYARLNWRDFEPEMGVYDFEAFERANHLDRWWQEGKRLVLRFVMDEPGDRAHRDIPDWLYEAMGDDAGTAYENSLGQGFSPNYSHVLLRERHQAAIQALGARYDGHPGMAFVELGSLGHDGGWTVEGVGGDWAMPPSIDLKFWVWAYTSAFPETPLLASAPYQPIRLTGIGLYNDGLGDEQATWDWLDTIEYGGYDTTIGAELRGMSEFYRTAPSGAHIARSVDQQALFGGHVGTLLRELRLSHTTYVGGARATGLNAATRDSMAVALSTMGYRLWVREASWPRAVRAGYRLSVDFTMRNDGAQAFSQRWPMELSLFEGETLVYKQQTDVDVRMFAPGSAHATAQIDVPFNLRAGHYQLALAILTPHDEEPAVELAMNAARVGLRSLLGPIEVKSA